ncbi:MULTISPECIES: hypothetical protein [Vibrio]|uniref:hypothetical protein n=1 Tax=Vibrio TaxID=662 RepID=UPI0002D8A0DF|nr:MULTISPECIES: hypothetical protein [Vibrio]OCH57679.1 hypothetical protein A6E08_18125 [Vibrio lentus]PMI46389.1 hypothetical protein BCU43_04115 [Vibrio lentus]
MKKLLMVGLLLAATPVLAQNAQNGGLVANQKVDCAAGGCTLVCKAPNQKAYVRHKKIDEAQVLLFGSGLMVYKLEMVGADRQVMIPPGTESCDLRNIR